MLQGIELAMAAAGLWAVCRGRLTLSERCIVRGNKARLLGLIAMLPALGVIAALISLRTSAHPTVWPFTWLAQLTAIAFCAVVVYALGLRWGRNADAD
jgi:hypothetical protein